MEIREITSENVESLLQQCVALQKHLVKPDSVIDKEQFIATAKDHSSYFVGIFENENLLGMGVVSRIIHPVMTNGYVNNIVVHPSSRGRGYGKVIMDTLENKAKEWGCKRVELTCSRAEVQPMYEKRGYIKKETNFYILKI